LVLDPFAGSGTTLVVAKKLGRRYIGFELSGEYAQQARRRLAQARVGDALNGSPEPLVSVPDTANGRRLENRNGNAKNRTKSRNKPSADQKVLRGF